MIAITKISAAIPLKIAPATKYGPKMVLCHMGAIAMAKSQATTVCTETATARMMQAISFMARSSACHSRSLPVQPSDSAR